MAVVIRFRRTGTKKKPRYRIVAIDKRFARDGRCIETLGNYNPFDREKGLTVNSEKVSSWIKKGAKLSNTLKKLFKKAKVNI